jgi:hypothetical protein
VNRPHAAFTAPRSNPFSTRFTRPGQVTPLDADGRPLDLDALLHRLLGLGGRAAIEGPHGSGKTSLLTALAARIVTRGGCSRVVRVRGSDAATVFVDGWERVARPVAALANWRAARLGRSLVVTAHRATGLPLLHRCRTSTVVLSGIVRQLPDHEGRVSVADLADAFARHSGNLREALYDLYDRYEQRGG